MNLNLCAKTLFKWFFACKFINLMNSALGGDNPSIKKKIIMRINLVSILITMACAQVSASGYAQLISLSKKDVPLKTVFLNIQKQTDYNFFWRGENLTNVKVSIKLQNASIDDALKQIFKDLPFTYSIVKKSIVIKKKKTVFAISVQDSIVNVKGKVSDSTGIALTGVIIKIKGSSKGTATDASGNYSIDVPRNGILVFRYVGFREKELPVNASGRMNVVLSEASSGLDEVVVVAYGTQKKATVTGAISSIQTKEIKQSPAANLAVTLAGRLPGLTAVQRSGEPGRDLTQIFIRGQGTVNSQSPVILVDGIERDLTYIDPNEIESVTILKDASSTAIFGVRGANGVILVTTRRGTSEIPEINFSTELSAQDFTRFIIPVNSFEFAQLKNQALKNDGMPYQFTAEQIEKYRSGVDRLRYPDTDWPDIITTKYSTQQRQNLNVSGAGKAMKYFVNAGYLHQGGQFKTEKDLAYDPSFFLNRYNFRSNIDVQLNKSLKAFLNVAGYLEKRNSPFGITDNPSAMIIAYLNNLPATIPGPVTPDGGVITSDIISAPAYGQLNRSGYTQRTSSNVIATYGMEQSLDFIAKNLSVKAVMSFDASTINNLNASRNYEKYVQVIDQTLKGADGLDSVYYRKFDDSKNTPLAISGSRAYNSLSNFQGSLNYHNSFDKHAVSGLLLYQQQKNIINEQLPYNLRGLAARLTYGYDAKYLFEFNAGYNGSEQFAKGRRFGFFPAVSGGWLLSREKFLQDNKVITLLKLRGSYGEVGNDRIGGARFLYLDDIQMGGGGYSESLGYGERVNINLLRNEQLQWEVAKKANVGIELGLFDQVNIVVDLFKEKRDNILRYRGTVPALNGFPISTLPPVNIGVIENKGFEIEVNYKKVFSKDFAILSKLNTSFARNKQLFADEAQLSADYAYRYRQTGFRIGQNFGYVVDRYFESADDIKNSPLQNVGGYASRPGDFKYKDLNGDHIVDERDRAPIGYSGVPEYTFGGAFNITYKNFDLSVLVQGVTNVYNYYQGRGTWTWMNYNERHLQSWTAERAAKGEPILYPRITTQVPSPNEQLNTFFNIDASYIRIKNAEFGYVLPENLAKKIGAKRIRLYANGLNLFTWDRLPTKDFDPELNDGLAYPVTRLYNFGLNFTF